MSCKNVKKTIILGMLSAFAAVLSYIESLLPVFYIPGVKLGLANLAVVLTLYSYGTKSAAAVNFVRILIVGIVYGNPFSMLFSLAGAVFSLAVMAVIKKTRMFSITGVSVAGGVSHNVAQIFAAAVVVETYAVMYYAPALIISGIVTGTVIGLIASCVNKYIKFDSFKIGE